MSAREPTFVHVRLLIGIRRFVHRPMEPARGSATIVTENLAVEEAMPPPPP